MVELPAWQVPVARAEPRSFGPSDETVDARFRTRAASHPERIAVWDDIGTLTYGALDAAANRLAAALQRGGLAPGDRVAVLLGNGRDFLLAYLGAMRAGAVPVPFHPQLGGEELPVLLGHCEPAVVIAEADRAHVVEAVRPGLPAARYIATDPIVPAVADVSMPSGGAAPAAIPLGWESLLGLAATPGEPNTRNASATTAAAIHYTSGTTGRAKGVVLSHGAIIATADIKARAYALHPASVVFSAPPLHHAAAMNSAVHQALLAAGCTVALTRRLEPAAVADLLAARCVTFTWMVATLYLWLLDLPDLAARDLAALEACLFAAMPMPAEGIRRLAAALPHVRLIQNYGQTENTPMCTSIAGGELLDRPGSVGRPLPGNVVQIRDANDRVCPPSTPGEVWHRGPSVMLGYFNDAEATANALRDGWLRTGDTGYLDADGYLYLRGRMNEVVNRGGVKMSPAEIEDVLLRHPAVREAAVLGIPDAFYGQTVGAAVVLRDGAAATTEALRAHCRDRIAHHKVPERIIFVANLPRNVMGKVQKHRLLSLFDSQ